MIQKGCVRLLSIAIWALQPRMSYTAGDDAIEATWEFDRSLDGWGQASPAEMDAEVQWGAGMMRGTVLGPDVHIDSPRFRLDADDRHHVVVRMRSFGAATVGRLELRRGAAMPEETDHSLNPWTQRGDPSVVGSSRGGMNSHHAADGDLYTLWEAFSSSNEWVTVDLGSTRVIEAVRLQGIGGGSNPRNIRVQSGGTKAGEFHTVANLTLTNSSGSQEFAIPASSSRFWRLYVIDTIGVDEPASLREVEFLGPLEATTTQPLDFDIFNDNSFHMYYVPIHLEFQGVLAQLRLRPGLEIEAVEGKTLGSKAPMCGDAFEIDWIRLARAPHVNRVEGCLDRAYPDPGPQLGHSYAVSNVSASAKVVNGFLRVGRTEFWRAEGFVYGTTHNCLRGGGQTITVSGSAFGEAGANVLVGGVPCSGVSHTAKLEQTQLTCVLPPSLVPPTEVWMRDGSLETVTVSSGSMPGLQHHVPYLSYQVPPPRPAMPELSNIAACSIDVNWEPPNDYWAAMTTTGYQVGWRAITNNDIDSLEFATRLTEGEGMADNLVTTGNVTTTTVTGLSQGQSYVFWVRAMAENVSDPRWDEVDLYGRREPLEGALMGPFSQPTNATATLQADVMFSWFNANSTLNYSAADSRATLGPRGQWAGEGHYGIQLVGTAQIENCNRSAACCDGYEPPIDSGRSGSCGVGERASPFSCSASATPGQVRLSILYRGGLPSCQPRVWLNGGLSPPKSGPPVEGALPSSAVVASHSEISRWGFTIAHNCGRALRLTASRPFSTGAAWYPRAMTVGEGFDTTFVFELSSPSLRCNVMDGVYTSCRSRGADGLAFVIQGEGPLALGDGGMGLGYSGIGNSLAVEFDTFYNAELQEPYENHVSVQTRGWRERGSSSQSYSLGSTPNVPDLTDGPRSVRIVYTPALESADIFSGRFQITGHTGACYFMENGAFSGGGMPDWGTGVGLLSVYVDDLSVPCMTVPLNLEATLKLHHGRAFVGFTAATGTDTWQVHDLHHWMFTSTREKIPYWPPPIVNGEGAYESCLGEEGCVHP
ncbi:unnamed protein product [Discosporangium mesarthrocarpum]